MIIFFNRRVLVLSFVIFLLFPYGVYAQSINYSYDANGRLTVSTRIENDTAIKTTYTYDNNGNLKNQKTYQELWRDFSVSTFPVNDNYGFENDKNQNKLPDLWETAWRNGTSTASYASIYSPSPSELPVEGSKVYRLFSGNGDPSSYQYVLSDLISVSGNSSYRIQAYMRYLLSVGTAEMTIIQLDENNNTLDQSSQTYKYGNGRWNKNHISFITKENTTHIVLRFGVGGQEGATLDIDKVRFTNTALSTSGFNDNSSFELDHNSDGLPDLWATNWRNGSSIGSYATQSAKGIQKNISFDGINDKVSLGDLGKRPDKGTIEFWMLSDDVGNYRNPFSTNSGNIGIRFEQSKTGNSFSVVIGNDSGTYSSHTYTKTSNSLIPGTWNHFALSWDSVQNKVWGYMNGELMFSDSQTLWNTNFNDVKLGIGFSNAAERSFKGKLRDVRIWDMSRSQSEITQSMNTVNSKETALKGRWLLNEGMGSTVYDSTSNGKNGVIIEGSWSTEQLNPVDGKFLYQLYNGTGDRTSYQYVLSDAINVKGNTQYRIQSQLHYMLSRGSVVETILELNTDGEVINETQQELKDGSWDWTQHSSSIVTKTNTARIAVRFSVGGQEAAYLDIDKVELEASGHSRISLNGNSNFEKDENLDGKPDLWELTWRNGNSQGSYARSESNGSIEGTHYYQLFSGTGDPGSYVYALSDKVAVTGGASYQLSASMRYNLLIGNAVMSVMEFSDSGATTNENHLIIKKGQGGWNLNSISFTAKPSTTQIAVRFSVGGQEAAYLDIDQVNIALDGAADVNDNGSFETGNNLNGLPDAWGTIWRNGSSINAKAERLLSEFTSPTDGLYLYRLYNGTGDIASYQYVLSDPIPVVGNVSYSLNAALRYTLNQGGHAEMSVIQLDKAGNNIFETHSTAHNGEWQWHNQYVDFETLPQTDSIRIRFAVGGETGAYLDVDQVKIITNGW